MSRTKSRKQVSADSGDAPTIESASGPLGPWRLAIAVGAAAATTGMPLATAASEGGQVDLALGRSFGVAFVVWVAIGAINRVLAQVETARILDDHTANLANLANLATDSGPDAIPADA